MGKSQVNNPLHGITLEQIVKSLVEYYGWTELGNVSIYAASNVTSQLNPA